MNELHSNTGNKLGKIEILTTTVTLGHFSNNILERSIKDEEKPGNLSVRLFSLSQTFSRFPKPSKGFKEGLVCLHIVDVQISV